VWEQERWFPREVCPAHRLRLTRDEHVEFVNTMIIGLYDRTIVRNLTKETCDDSPFSLSWEAFVTFLKYATSSKGIWMQSLNQDYILMPFVSKEETKRTRWRAPAPSTLHLDLALGEISRRSLDCWYRRAQIPWSRERRIAGLGESDFFIDVAYSTFSVRNGLLSKQRHREDQTKEHSELTS